MPFPVPELEPQLAAPQPAAQQCKVEFGIDASNAMLTFTMTDLTDPKLGYGKVIGHTADGWMLIVPPGIDRDFRFTLSSAWQWIYDPDSGPNNVPFSIKRGNPQLYGVQVISDTEILISAKARPKGTPPTRDFFNLYVSLMQQGANPVSIRIDPGSDNPP